MKSRWSDSEFRSVVDSYVRSGLNPDLATRVYTTRLLGGDPQLVLHGGGNTSVKTVVTDADGGEVEVLCVKGSGWDMGSIEPAGLPAVRLKELAALARFDDAVGRRDGAAAAPAVDGPGARPTHRSKRSCMR